LRFIVWPFLKARLQFTLDQFNGATSICSPGRGLVGRRVGLRAGAAVMNGQPGVRSEPVRARSGPSGGKFIATPGTATAKFAKT
jgi:hypothetical protein